MKAADKVVEYARSLIGMKENGGDNHVYIMDEQIDEVVCGMNMQNQPWCEFFVTYCFCKCFGNDNGAKMLYQQVGSVSCGCRATADIFAANGALYHDNPQRGDLIFFYSGGDINHVGLVDTVVGTQINCIEGNYSDSCSATVHYLNQSTIAGYGRPKWSVVGDDGKSEQTTTQTTTQVATQTTAQTTSIVQNMSVMLPLVKPRHSGQDIEAVKTICEILKRRGLYKGEVVTKYNTELQEASKKLQMHYGLTQDAEWGTNTWSKAITEVW